MTPPIHIPALARVGFPEGKMPQLAIWGIGMHQLSAYLLRGPEGLGELLDSLVRDGADSKPSFECRILGFSLCPCFGAAGLEYLLDRGTKPNATLWDLTAASLGTEMYIDHVRRGAADDEARRECAAMETILRGVRMKLLLQSLDDISNCTERPRTYFPSGDSEPYSEEYMQHLAGLPEAREEHSHYTIRALRLRRKLAAL